MLPSPVRSLAPSARAIHRASRRGLLLALLLLLGLAPAPSLADLILTGATHLGDNELNGLVPLDPVRYQQIRAYPIHFQLSSPVTVHRISLAHVQGLEPDGFVRVFIDGIDRGRGAPGATSVEISDTPLATGLHTIALTGQCYDFFGKPAPCTFFRDQDDFAFDAITLHTLPASGATTAIHAVQKHHLGDFVDNDDDYDPTGSRPFYPDRPEGSQLSLPVILNEPADTLVLDLYRLRSLDRPATVLWDGTAIARLVPGADSVDLQDDPFRSSHLFGTPQPAGRHLLTIQPGTIAPGNIDDISWDELILTPSIQAPGEWKMEAARVSLPATTSGSTSFKQVNFQQSYGRPPLVFVLATSNGGAPCALRVRNVTTTGFELAQLEPSGENGPHTGMTVDYLALTAGEHFLPDGTRLVAGTISTSAVQHHIRNGPPESWAAFSFARPFAAPPAMLSQIQTMNNETNPVPGAVSVPWLSVALARITATGGELALERSEAAPGTLDQPERIAYLAVEAGKQGRFTDNHDATVLWETIRSADSIRGWDNGCFTVPFAASYADKPLVVATKNSHDGADGGWLRRCRLTPTGVGLTVDEDRFQDRERSHNTERAGVLVFSQPFAVQFFAAANVDHYELHHDGQGLTCQPETVTVKACQNQDCSQLYTGAVTLTLAPPGWLGGDTKTFSGGSASFELAVQTPSTVTLAVGQANPDVPFSCVGNGVAGACTLEFFDSGFTYQIPTQVAGKESTAITVRAVRKDDASQTCVPAFARVTKTIDFSFSYLEPASGNQPLLVNDTALPAPLALTFDADGQADITLRYQDAGQLQLDSRYQDGALVLTGQANFVTRPAGLCVEPADPAAACPAANSDCPVFVRAGEIFPLSVKAVQWQNDSEADSDFCDNPTTPNFRLENIGLSLGLVAPASGSPGSLGQTALDITANGTATVDQSISEVGVFTITADPPPYLTAGDVIPASTSVPVGRLVPARFTVAVEEAGGFASACTGFSYTGQPFGYAPPPRITITAENTGGAPLQNYRDGFRKLRVNNIHLSYPNRDSIQTGADATTLLAVTSVPDPGSATLSNSSPMLFTLGNDSFSYDRTLPVEDDNARIGPFFSNLALTVTTIRDSDGITAGNLPLSFTPAGIEIRYGLATLANVFGPEQEPLTMPAEASFFDGLNWLTNDLDTCSVFSYTSTENSTISASVSPSPPVALAAGQATLTLTPTADPGEPGGSIRIDADFPPWLEPDPVAEASFGLYRGNDRIINWKEIVR